MTVVPPSTGRIKPDDGTQVTTGLSGLASEAVAVKLITAPEGPVASTVMLPGRLSVGGVVSQLMTVAVTVRESVLVSKPPVLLVPTA